MAARFHFRAWFPAADFAAGRKYRARRGYSGAWRVARHHRRCALATQRLAASAGTIRGNRSASHADFVSRDRGTVSVLFWSMRHFCRATAPVAILRRAASGALALQCGPLRSTASTGRGGSPEPPGGGTFSFECRFCAHLCPYEQVRR
jgi:hypothetical protein